MPAPLRAHLAAALADAAVTGAGCWAAARPYVQRALRHVDVRTGAEPLLVADALLTLAYAVPEPPAMEAVLNDLAQWVA